MSGGRLPSVAVIVEALQKGALSDRSEPSVDGISVVMDPVLALHRNNIIQWECEDDARRDSADDTVVASAKRDIDRLNGVRHRLIEAIDHRIASSIDLRDGAPLVTESPGMAIDRLSVLIIRLASTETRASSGCADATLFAERLPRLRRQLGALEEGIGLLLDDLARGNRSFVVYESLKLYGGKDAASFDGDSEAASRAAGIRHD
ncbi:MAG: DUF4254 domain-containing protein [Acidimicrobiales bacterium]